MSDYSQAGDLYRLLPADEKTRLIENIAGAMHSITDDLKRAQLKHFAAADADYGARVAKALGMEMK